MTANLRVDSAHTHANTHMHTHTRTHSSNHSDMLVTVVLITILVYMELRQGVVEGVRGKWRVEGGSYPAGRLSTCSHTEWAPNNNY